MRTNNREKERSSEYCFFVSECFICNRSIKKCKVLSVVHGEMGNDLLAKKGIIMAW